jgi:hypothetical protein
MIACPWCDEEAAGLLDDAEAETYRCPACGTCVDLVEVPVSLDLAA